MKKTIILLTTAFLFGVYASDAQTADNKWGFGAHFGVMEINGDYTKQFYSFTQGYGAGLSLARYLNPSFDVVAHLFYDRTHGVDGWKSELPTWLDFKAHMFNLNLLAKYKFNNGYLLKESARVAPFLLAGFGGNLSSTTGMGEAGMLTGKKLIKPNLYGGLGLNVRISQRISLAVQTAIMLPSTDDIDGISGAIAPVSTKGNDKFLQNSVSLWITLGKIKPKDTDGDGVPDNLDKCPGTPAGVKVDADGCPLVTVKEPDKGDRAPDAPKEIKVVAIPNPPDTDHDGIPDSVDACPDKAGIPELKGCPPDAKYVTEKYNLSEKPVYFDFDSSVLKPSETEALDKIVRALADHKEFGIQLDGFADSIGSDEYNLKLSERRANAVKSYLLKKGVSEKQIMTHGYGEAKPASDNGTKEGRRLNRRVEYRLFELVK